jgi:hypothetical protein
LLLVAAIRAAIRALRGGDAALTGADAAHGCTMDHANACTIIIREPHIRP